MRRCRACVWHAPRSLCDRNVGNLASRACSNCGVFVGIGRAISSPVGGGTPALRQHRETYVVSYALRSSYGFILSIFPRGKHRGRGCWRKYRVPTALPPSCAQTTLLTVEKQNKRKYIQYTCVISDSEPCANSVLCRCFDLVFIISLLLFSHLQPTAPLSLQFQTWILTPLLIT